MKASITSFDLRVLVAEWQGLLGGHFDKIYQRDDEVMFRINVPDRGKVELYSKAGQWLCLHEVEDKPESPPPFAQTLRRLLDNARVTAVEQRGVVRILATVLNLGGTYAEELCLRAGVDKETRVKDLQDGQIDSLYTALNNIAVAIDQEKRPAVVLQEGRAIDATPIELRQYREME